MKGAVRILILWAALLSVVLLLTIPYPNPVWDAICNRMLIRNYGEEKAWSIIGFHDTVRQYNAEGRLGEFEWLQGVSE